MVVGVVVVIVVDPVLVVIAPVLIVLVLPVVVLVVVFVDGTRQSIAAIHGFGPFAAANALQLLGGYERIPLGAAPPKQKAAGAVRLAGSPPSNHRSKFGSASLS